METDAETPQGAPHEPAKPRRRTTRSPAATVESAAPIVTGDEAVGDEAMGNDTGAIAAHDASAAPKNGTDRPSTERAEELFDELGQRVGQAASALMVNLKRFAARTQEEAEDIWAEAQDVRRGKGS